MRLHVFAVVLACGTISGCASLDKEPSKTEHIAVDAAADFKPVAYTASSGLSDYHTATASGQAEWLSCRLKTARATVLLMHSDRQGYDPVSFCRGWHAQTFLSAGYDVVAINRPGFGNSTGTPDCTGPTSVAAMTVLPTALASAKLPLAVTGVWGYGSGATAAALVAKQLKGLKFLIVGGGIYDYEEALRTTTDQATKADIAAIKKLGGDKAIEDRSAAYEITGLPPTIAVYHGAIDTVAPLNQAKAFADSLTSSGHYKVSYQVLDKQPHDIPWIYHRHVLAAMLNGITGP